MRSQGSKSGNKREWVSCLPEGVSVHWPTFVWLSSLANLSLQRWAMQKWAQSWSRARMLWTEKGVRRENKGGRTRGVWSPMGKPRRQSCLITMLLGVRPERAFRRRELSKVLLDLTSLCDSQSFSQDQKKRNRNSWSNGVSGIISVGSVFCLQIDVELRCN